MKNTNIGRRLLSLTAGVVVAGFLAGTPNSVQATAWQQDGVIIKGEKGSEATDVREGQQRYGPITSNDTLWAIAREYRPHSSVTQYQTMVAIAQANPRAFVEGNLNRMLDGFYLRIPSLQEIQMINPETARRRVLADQQLETQQQRLSQAEQQTQMTREQQQQLLSEARERAEQVIQQVEQQQQQSFSQLQAEVNESMQAVQRVYDENEQIQQRLDALAQRIEELANGLQQTDDLEQQFEQLLQQQQQLMAAQQQQQPSSGFLEWLKSPLNLVLLAVLPALLIIAGLYFFLFRRRNTASEASQPSAKKVEEMDDEAASKALDRELMEGGQDSDSDGLFDLDGDFDGEDDDLGDDLSALEAELTQTGQTHHDDDDFSIRLDDEDEDDDDEVSASDNDLTDDELSDDDTALLPGDDIEQPADETSERQTSGSNQGAGTTEDTEEDGEAALSQDELDKLFAESDDDEPALDLSLDDEEENVAEPDEQLEADAEVDDAPVSEPESTDEDEAVASAMDKVDDDELVETGSDDTDHEDADEADEALAQLGIDDKDDPNSDDSEDDEQDLESLLRESETLESELSEIDAIEKQLPAEDETPAADTDSSDDEGYVDIDKLMEDADDDSSEEDNYQSSAVEELLNDEELDNLGESDAEVDEQASAQLDLARAYIDMGEEDEAKDILQQLVDGEDETLAADAKALLARINT